MVRTQIQLTEKQYRRLKKESATKGVSMAELIRQGVEHVLGQPQMLQSEDIRREALELMGKFKSGKRDISEKHDEYLVEGYR